MIRYSIYDDNGDKNACEWFEWINTAMDVNSHPIAIIRGFVGKDGEDITLFLGKDRLLAYCGIFSLEETYKEMGINYNPIVFIKPDYEKEYQLFLKRMNELNNF